MLNRGPTIDETAESLSSITRAVDALSRSLSHGLTRFRLTRPPASDFEVANAQQAEHVAAWTAAVVERMTQRLRETRDQIEAARAATDQAVVMVTELTAFVGGMMDGMASTRDFIALMRASNLGVEADQDGRGDPGIVRCLDHRAPGLP